MSEDVDDREAAGGAVVDRAGAGTLNRDLRAVSGICRPAGFALGGIEL